MDSKCNAPNWSDGSKLFLQLEEAFTSQDSGKYMRVVLQLLLCAGEEEWLVKMEEKIKEPQRKRSVWNSKGT